MRSLPRKMLTIAVTIAGALSALPGVASADDSPPAATGPVLLTTFQHTTLAQVARTHTLSLKVMTDRLSVVWVNMNMVVKGKVLHGSISKLVYSDAGEQTATITLKPSEVSTVQTALKPRIRRIHHGKRVIVKRTPSTATGTITFFLNALSADNGATATVRLASLPTR